MVTYLFWHGRDIDNCEVIRTKNGADAKEQIGRFYITHGWKRVTLPPREVLLARKKKLQRQLRKVEAMLSPRRW